jgi:hypothetical protein
MRRVSSPLFSSPLLSILKKHESNQDSINTHDQRVILPKEEMMGRSSGGEGRKEGKATELVSGQASTGCED